MNAPARTEKTKALCVATRCTSVDQFVETFQRFCDESSFFVATLTTRPVGLETPFAIQLADRTPVLRGICVVLDAWATADNKFKRPGIRLGIKRLTPDSTATYARLREAALASSLEVEDNSVALATGASVAYPANAAVARAITGETERTQTEDDPMAMHTAVTKEGPGGNELREQAAQLGRVTPVRPLSVVPPSSRITPPAIPAVIPPPRLVTAPTDAESWQQKRAQTNPIVGTPAAVGPRAFEQSGTTASRAPKYTDKTADNEKTAPDEPLIIIENGDPPKLPTNEAGRVELVPRGRQKPKLEAVRPAVPAIPDPKDAVPERREDSLSIPQEPVSAVPAMPIPREPTSALPAMLRPPAAAPRSVPIIVPPARLFDSKPTEVAAPAPKPVESAPPSRPTPAPAPTPSATPFGVAVVSHAPLEPTAQSLPTGEIPPAGEDGRVPGSELILPANPLSNVPDESISGFIDCTLYEETANFVKAVDEDGQEVDPLVPPPPPVERRPRGPSVAPVSGTIPPPLSAPIATIAPAMAAAAAAANGDVGAPVAFVAVDAFGRPTTIPPWMAMPPPSAPPPPPQAVPTPIAGALAPPSGPISANRARARAATPGGGVAIEPALAPRIPRRSQTESEAFSAKRKGRWLLAALPLVAVGAAAAALYMTGFFDKRLEGQQVALAQPSGSAVPVDAVVAQVADAAEAAADPVDVEPKPDKKPDKPPVADPGDPDEGDPTETIGDVPVVGDGPCLLTITSTPAGSTVLVDGRTVGPSPITVAGPCIRRKVDVTHPRYKLGTQWVNLVASKPSSVDLRLVRPTHSLHITTFPIGATISIGGRRAGTSPAVVQVMGFSGVTVKVEKPGFKPVSTKVYSKQPKDKLFVRLTR